MDATAPALESRTGAATGVLALVVSDDPAVSGPSFLSLARHASIPNTMIPTYIL
jgi:hypothetical protein